VDEPARPIRIATAEVYLGICSWADAHFVKSGGFYPAAVATRPAQRLQYYATVFPTVEIDATYYSLLAPDQADRWAALTPGGFLFHVKAFGLFTGHAVDARRLPQEVQALLPAEVRGARQVDFRRLPREVEEACWAHFTAFCRRLDAGGRLGYLLFQFPRWSTPSPGMFRRLGFLRQTLAGYRVAVEFRHRSWLTPPHRATVEAVLREHDLIYVIPDEPALSWTVPPEVLLTSGWSVVRFHGRNAAAWAKRGATTDEVYDYDYRDEELRPWAGTARELAGQVERLFLMFNNHYRGNSARNAATLAAMLGGAA